MIELKWRSFGLKMFLLKELWFIIHLILFMVAHLGDPDGCSEEAGQMKIVLTLFAALTLAMGLVIDFFFCRNTQRDTQRDSHTLCAVLTLVTQLLLLLLYENFLCRKTISLF